jgi:hypothetical protein
VKFDNGKVVLAKDDDKETDETKEMLVKQIGESLTPDRNRDNEGLQENLPEDLQEEQKREPQSVDVVQNQNFNEGVLPEPEVENKEIVTSVFNSDNEQKINLVPSVLIDTNDIAAASDQKFVDNQIIPPVTTSNEPESKDTASLEAPSNLESHIHETENPRNEQEAVNNLNANAEYISEYVKVKDATEVGKVDVDQFDPTDPAKTREVLVYLHAQLAKLAADIKNKVKSENKTPDYILSKHGIETRIFLDDETRLELLTQRVLKFHLIHHAYLKQVFESQNLQECTHNEGAIECTDAATNTETTTTDDVKNEQPEEIKAQLSQVQNTDTNVLEILKKETAVNTEDSQGETIATEKLQGSEDI